MSKPTKHIDPTAFAMICGCVRILAVYFLLTATVGIAWTILTAFSMAGNPFGEIPDVWYALTNDFRYTWGHHIGNIIAGITLWFACRPVARLCLPTIDPNACVSSGYDLSDSAKGPCPECGSESTR